MHKQDLPRFVWIFDADRGHRIYHATRHGQAAGTVYFQEWGPQQGNWYWSGNVPSGTKSKPTLPNKGYEETALAAIRLAERYWFENGGT